jgi:hypothetical protein
MKPVRNYICNAILTPPEPKQHKFAANDNSFRARQEALENAPRTPRDELFLLRREINERVRRKWRKVPKRLKSQRKLNRIIRCVKNVISKTTQYSGTYAGYYDGRYIDGIGPAGGGGDISADQIYLGIPQFTQANATLTTACDFAAWADDPRFHSHTVPAEWPNAASAGNYFIDNSHPAATDTDNPFGYPKKPRVTPPTMDDLPAGTVVEFGGGSGYQFNINRAAGTEADPVWVRGTEGLPISKMPVFGGEIRTPGSEWLYIENMRWQNGLTGTLLVTSDFNGLSGGDCHHLVLRDCYGVDMSNVAGGGMISVYATDLLGPEAPGNPGAKTNDIVIYSCTFNGLFEEGGDWFTIDNDYHGISIVTRHDGNYAVDERVEVKRVWILDCDLRYISGNGVQLIDIGTPLKSWRERQSYVWVGGCLTGFSRQSGLFSKRASNVIFSQNVCDTALDDYIASNGQAFGYQRGPTNLWWIGNRAFLCHYGIQQTDTTNEPESFSDVYMVGNVIHDTYTADPNIRYFMDGVAISLTQHDNSNRWIVGNTGYNCTHGIVSSAVETKGKVRSASNIFALRNGNTGGGSDVGWFYYIDSYDPVLLTDFEATGDLLYRLNGDFAIVHDGNSYTSLASANAIPEFSGLLEGDPLITDPATDNYAPALGSPAIGAGTYQTSDGVNVADVFDTLYGMRIDTHDYLSKTRNPLNFAIGAKEPV